jgi:hypothetical protein
LEEFIDKGLTLLLEGKGADFVEYYYEYLQRIYDRDILLAKIANKSRVKQTIESYKKRCTQRTKAGNLMARQAHMELIIRNNLQVSLGDTIYYVNNGTAMSHGDVQRKKKKDGTEEVVLNSYLISENDLENGMKGEYNIPRYINVFNKRVEPLLVCFNQEVRESILKKNPEDREYYTKTQCELINGVPRKDADQDELDDILTLSDEEKTFWLNTDTSEDYFMEELGLLNTV